MGLTADEIAGHPALHDCIRRQAQSLVLAFEANPRLASVFATQQRWLLAHVGVALYFRRDPLDPSNGLRTARFLDVVREHAVASRNTAQTCHRRGTDPLATMGFARACFVRHRNML
jgi:hypothetical protein